jgi:3D-(3,5/4)-trihydroxycyclohexane-1,2-dione acylhydrolase (decyclizing)
VCVGTRLIDLTTGSHSLFQHPDVRFVAVNVTARDAYKLGALPVVADAKLALRAVVDALARDGWRTPEAWRGRALEEKARWERALSQDLAARDGERMSQGQLLRALNAASQPEDWLVVASGTPHVDAHKLWDPSTGARCLMEVGFSCMAGEIPAALGVRMARPDLGEVFVLIGDGNYLMGATGELVTARQERLKLTVIVVQNHGFQSIHGLQRGRTGRSFGLEFRERSADGSGLGGAVVEVDYAANARSLGCAVFVASSLDEFRAALDAAREAAGPVVIVARVEPRRLLLDSDCWWDVGVPEASERTETRDRAAEHVRGRRLQRYHGPPPQ